jgi:FG-GAP-like repeat
VTGMRYLAVTQLELNLQLSGNANATGHYLRALLLDPSRGWEVQKFDMRYPGSNQGADTGQFIVSAVGDLHGDGRSEIVYAVTVEPSACHILAYRHDGGGWRCSPVITGLPSVDLVRSIALGDVDEDGADEIVVATRPNGAVLILDGGPAGYAVTTIDRDQYGAGTTNTREVTVADVDSDGAQEILVATARADSEKWQATPGAIFLYRRCANGWDRTLIDDHGAQTHTRMVAVADVKNDGINRIISSRRPLTEA